MIFNFWSFFFCFENVDGFPFLYNVITSSIDTRSLGKKKNFTTFPVILFTWNKTTFDHCAKKISKKIPYCDKDRITLSRRKFLLLFKNDFPFIFQFITSVYWTFNLIEGQFFLFLYYSQRKYLRIPANGEACKLILTISIQSRYTKNTNRVVFVLDLSKKFSSIVTGRESNIFVWREDGGGEKVGRERRKFTRYKIRETVGRGGKLKVAVVTSFHELFIVAGDDFLVKCWRGTAGAARL